MRSFLLVAVLVLVAWTTNAQKRYAYLPEGKTEFETSTEKIVIRYKSSVAANQRLLKFVDDSSFNQVRTGIWNIVTLQKTLRNRDSLAAVLNNLKQDSSLLNVAPCLIYKGKIFQGMTDQVLVRLKKGMEIKNLSDTFKRLDIQTVKKDEYIEREFVLTINPRNKYDALDVANQLYETGAFEFCEPNFLVLNAINTVDPYYSKQWNLQNTGQIPGSTAGADIKASQTWCITKGENIIVAVLDEGVDLTQPDLQGRLVTGFDETGQGSNGAPSGNDAHGTACAGIIAANADNNIGVTGIAPNAKIMPVRIGYDGMVDISAASAGFTHAAASGAEIISCSWQLGSSSQYLQNAINNALNTGRNTKGCIVLFAAGNDNNGSINYPASLAGVIAVGGSNMCDQRLSVYESTPPNSCNYDNRADLDPISWGSNYGTELSVVAPCINIPTTDIKGNAGFSAISVLAGWKTPNVDYLLNFDGTSAAAPHAAGVMALILSINPGLHYTAARTILESSCDKVGGYSYSTWLANGSWNNEMGYGRINALQAVNNALGSIKIAGADYFCTGSSVFSVPNLTNQTVTWSVAGSSASLSCTNCNQTTLTKTGTAPVTLTATISKACKSTAVSKLIYVGSAPVNLTSAQGGCNNGFQTWTLTAGPSANATNWSWSVDYLSPGSSINLSSSIGPATYAEVKGGGTVKVTYTDVCGTTGSNGMTVYSICPTGLSGNSFTVFPNPAASNVTITPISGIAPKEASSNFKKSGGIGKTVQGKIHSIKVIDMTGKIKKVFQYPTGGIDKANIDVNGLLPGVYLLEIFDGKNVRQQKLSIQR
ncbi:S8 family peptidase [Chryseobacterium populi]|uniref:Por secretion system C-terminal sorting domain containing protein n=1 Tax=Chryseobacterium populi TaxID=1144316 RepID=J3CM83_9FLAO|nr:S8 family peptidase [Chryseobacterium populi]EJL74346.1 Por secretion system C-terminal sorting domain containing protein [Chryseobacterium populi]